MKQFENLFFCYSIRLKNFLSILKFPYENSGFNENSKRQYWVYKRTDNLNVALQYWEKLKQEFSL